MLLSDVQQSDSVMCIYIHTHIYTYVHTHTHTRTYIYIHFFRLQVETLNAIAIIILNASLETSGSFIFSLSPRTLKLERNFLLYFLSIFFCFHSAHDLVHQLVNWSPRFSLLLYSTPNRRLGGGWALNSSAWS